MSNRSNDNYEHLLPIPPAYHIHDNNLNVREMCNPPPYRYVKKTYKKTREDWILIYVCCFGTVITILFVAGEISLVAWVIYIYWTLPL